MRQKLEAANPSMAAMIQDAVSEAATTVLDKTGVASRDYAAASSRVESLRAAGRLDENDVAAFATANQFEDDDRRTRGALRTARSKRSIRR